MSLLDDEDALLNETKDSAYNSLIHENIEWNQYEHQSFYDFREWVKMNIYNINDNINKIDEESNSGISDMRCQITELQYEIMWLKNEIMDLKCIINKNI